MFTMNKKLRWDKSDEIKKNNVEQKKTYRQSTRTKEKCDCNLGNSTGKWGVTNFILLILYNWIRALRSLFDFGLYIILYSKTTFQIG